MWEGVVVKARAELKGRCVRFRVGGLRVERVAGLRELIPGKSVQLCPDEER